MNGPTLSQVRAWPAVVSIPMAATALGISRSHAYELVARGEFPAKTLQLAGRRIVITHSLVQVLTAGDVANDAA